MDTERNVLVIAADATFRRSIAFLLEAEGYGVTAHASLHGAAAKGPARNHCAIIDEDAAGGLEVWDRLQALADAIVVLFSRALELPRNLPGHIRVQIVEKPPLGQDLVLAVRAALLPSRPAL
ncbi:MAG: hypothetical protein HC779_03505 [Phyllobacteriaceae bacterium]|nr:hypothetical protein [Phyllobacteriaceae bacterium]